MVQHALFENAGGAQFSGRFCRTIHDNLFCISLLRLPVALRTCVPFAEQFPAGAAVELAGHQTLGADGSWARTTFCRCRHFVGL
jgi:hypothetical protein